MGGDGKELFYIALDERLMAIPVRLGADGRTIDPGMPVPLFATHIAGGAVTQRSDRQQYMVSPDGQRFLIATVLEEAATSPITVILNWKPKP